MKYFLIGILLFNCTCGHGQILPSAQRQKILDREQSYSTPKTSKKTVVTVFAPEKTICAKPKFKKGVINIFNEYADSIVVTIFWPRNNTKQQFVVKAGKSIALPYEKCSSLIIFNSKKYFCTNELVPGTNYHITWDAESNCYCISDYN
jgi:hypothetical protein